MNRVSIEDLEHQIEDTRLALDQTLSTLRVELSPRHRLERAWRVAQDRTQRSLRAGARWASSHPRSTSVAAIATAGGLFLGLTKLLRRAR